MNGHLSFMVKTKFGLSEGKAYLSLREAEDFIEKLRLKPDVVWVNAHFAPDSFAI